MSDASEKVLLAIGSLRSDVRNLHMNQERLITYVRENNSRLETALNKHIEDDETLIKKVDDLEGFKKKVITLSSVFTVVVTAAFNLGLALIQRGGK